MPDLEGYLKIWGAAQSGAVAASRLFEQMSPRARERAEELCPGLAGVLVGAFPYYAGEREGNLSLYSRGEDYHIAVKRLLAEAGAALRREYPRSRFVPLVDASPLPEVRAAELAGIGLVGEHGLIICPPYGSYVFLGCILTDLPLETPGRKSPPCIRCGRCAEACPSGALRWRDGAAVFDSALCLSGVSQRKGALTPEEERRLKTLPTVWGCDLCQNACPYNASPAVTAIDALAGRTETAPYLADLQREALEGLPEKAFREKYRNRAFSWHGKSPLIRNLGLHKEWEHKA
ncbi:epoxyqueuosine reductase [Papillibacter cinnamivorans]|uniref:Epoxyqueuosine reductase QueG (Queuosine biosynthesis) n=1 Tax=Papillibacter cinnamivorans DSM 12816 TaxID=1122930 RepID=A0A1W2A7V0_9FIRM|nr:QueG-associated DUF1730 domain-containing protein [Papillibacter cinnamivorans]SMC56716.1 Epoxyqueuosine reductase QueG (queuosine biosynthesis) [Papillibacter cinnamivorans DSM 12816]